VLLIAFNIVWYVLLFILSSGNINKSILDFANCNASSNSFLCANSSAGLYPHSLVTLNASTISSALASASASLIPSEKE